MPKNTVEFFFDLSSPWTYLAFRGLLNMRQELDFELQWRPILVGGVFNTVNQEVYEHRANPNPRRWQYMMKDLQDWADYYDLQLHWPEQHPISSVKAMRGALLALEHDCIEDYSETVFAAYWTEQIDISTNDALRSFAQRCQLDVEQFMTGIQQDSIKQALRDNTQELMDRGGFGSPSMFLNGKDLYFGNDRLELLRFRLQQP